MGGPDTEQETAHKVNSGEENSPAAPAGIRTRCLLITSPALLPTNHPGSRSTCTSYQRVKQDTVPFSSEMPSFKQPTNDLCYTRTISEKLEATCPSCFPFIRSGQNHLARHSERGKKTRRTKEEVGRQNQGMDRPGVRQVPEGSGEQRKMEKTG